MSKRRIVLAVGGIGGVLLLGVGGLAGGYFAGASNGTGSFTDHYVAAKATAPAASPTVTPTPSQAPKAASPTTTPSPATMPGGFHQPTPQQVGTTQAVGQGLTMTVVGDQMVPLPQGGTSEVLEIQIVLHNPTAAAVQYDYLTLRLFGPDGVVQGNQGSVDMNPVPAHGDLDSHVYFHIISAPGHFDLADTVTGNQWDLPVSF